MRPRCDVSPHFIRKYPLFVALSPRLVNFFLRGRLFPHICTAIRRLSRGSELKRNNPTLVIVPLKPVEALNNMKRKSDESGKGDGVKKAKLHLTGPDTTAASYQALKGIVGALIKNSQAEVFLYPVDSKVFPEYYDSITKPMDLHTLRDQLNSRKSSEWSESAIEQGLLNLRQIWSNCRLFNAEGSDIYATADELDAECEHMVNEKLGPQWVKKYNPKGGKKSEKGAGGGGTSKASSSSSSSSTATTKISPPKKKGSGGKIALILPKKVIQKIIKEVKASEFSTPFLHPVDLSEAPGYMDVVDEAMDLSTIEKSCKQGVYDGVEGTMLLATHMRLIR